MSDPTLKTRRRQDYQYTLDFQTRWTDNDVYSHMNNAQYYHYFDAIVNTYLATYCYPPAGPSSANPQASPSSPSTPCSSQTALNASPPKRNPSPHASLLSTPLIGLVIHSSCTYLRPASFPGLITVGMRIVKLGKSSVEYECAVFQDTGVGERDEEACAVGRFVHVFVDRESRKVVEGGMGKGIRRGLRALVGQDGVMEKGRL